MTAVTVAIPAFNEEAAIGECLDRVRAQTWSDLEIVVADGGSSDRTREVVLEHAAADPRIRLIANPRRLQSAGLNEILVQGSGAVVVRLDARSYVDDDYVERCVTLLECTGSAVAGGRMVARDGSTSTARGIAIANHAPWGAGPARFHRAGSAGPAETVYLGTFDRTWLDRVGGWAEDVGVNEDYELNHRIRAAGGQVWLDPMLEVGYQPRTTFAALTRQYFRYGRSKATVMRRHPGSIRARQVLPVLLLPALVVACLPGPIGLVAKIAVGAYMVGVLVLALRSQGRIPERLAAWVAALVMHSTWAAGAWFGTVRPFHSAGRGR